MSNISIAASIFPTEDGERVGQAILNLFPGAELSMEGDQIHAIAPNMDHLIQRMEEQRIRDSARVILRGSVRDDSIVFYLNKQAAHVGKVNFTDGDSVLGDLKVTIITDEPDRSIRQMTGDVVE